MLVCNDQYRDDESADSTGRLIFSSRVAVGVAPSGGKGRECLLSLCCQVHCCTYTPYRTALNTAGEAADGPAHTDSAAAATHIGISGYVDWSREPCNPRQPRSARVCHPCLRSVLSPMCPGRTQVVAPREWTRTIDRTGNNRLLYQLSYRGIRTSNLLNFQKKLNVLRILRLSNQ